MWTPLSITHFKSAKHLAALSRELEEKYDGKSFAANNYINNSYVIGSVFAAVAFLESNINELIAEAKDGDAQTLLHKLTEAEINGIKTNSTQIESSKAAKAERISLILHKYKSFLKTVGKTDFEESIIDEASLLINLRNKLVHYSPEWISSDPNEKHNIEIKLEGKFKESKLFEGTGNPFYPDKCLGSGCADWSLKTAEKFADQFCQRLNIYPLYK